MAAAGGAPGTPVKAGEPTPARKQAPRCVADRLFVEGYAFDFFQAVRLLERLAPDRRLVGREGPPSAEVVRFRALNVLTFPPSAVAEVLPPGETLPLPALRVTFFGLTGPSGVMPRHYTELLMRLARDSKGPERRALGDWFDLFNHRLISLFYRAWEKYRVVVAYDRGEATRSKPDPFTQALYSLVGLGVPHLRNRLRVATPDAEGGPERVLARVDDPVLLYYGGLLRQRPRNAVGLEALIADYFNLPVRVCQFQGRWLPLEPANRTCLTGGGQNTELGASAVAGTRVWDVEGKFRLRLGPFDFAAFESFLPDPEPVRERKAFFLLSHLVRLYVGPELDFDVQLVLRSADVPGCRMSADRPAARLGWNTWLGTQPRNRDADEAVFDGAEVVSLGAAPPGEG
jgi:type VI secretion system protein ImpH